MTDGREQLSLFVPWSVVRRPLSICADEGFADG